MQCVVLRACVAPHVSRALNSNTEVRNETIIQMNCVCIPHAVCVFVV